MRIISIDPDMRKSGVAVLDGRVLETVAVLPFHELLETIMAQYTSDTMIIVEAGWLECHNWHVKRGDTPQKAAAIGRSTGMNHQTGMLICEWCRAKGYAVREVHPLRKCWRGRDGKITQEEIKAATGLKLPMMNQDARDALLLAWVHAGNPLRAVNYKPKNDGKKENR